MPYVSKSSCTHGIIISLWLICCIQCGFSISYLSIPEIVAHDRRNISQTFTFLVQFQCPMSCCTFHLYNCFSGGFKTGQDGRKLGGQECWVKIICFKILTCLISVNVFGLLSFLFIMRFIIIIISVYIIIIIINIVMVIIVLYHNQYNYPNNHQTTNYSFKGYLLFVLLLLLLLLSLLLLILILLSLLLLLLLFLSLLSFALSSILFVYVCIVLYPLIFFYFFLCHRLKINNHIPCI